MGAMMRRFNVGAEQLALEGGSQAQRHLFCANSLEFDRFTVPAIYHRS